MVLTLSSWTRLLALWTQSDAPTGALAGEALELPQGARASLTFSNDACGRAGSGPVAVAQGCRHPVGMCHPATPQGKRGRSVLVRARRELRPAGDSQGVLAECLRGSHPPGERAECGSRQRVRWGT